MNESDKKQAVYKKISLAIEQHIGEGITSRVIYTIKMAIQQALIAAANEGLIPITKIQEDGQVKVQQSRQHTGNLDLLLPKWLEEWLIAEGPVEEILEAPPEGESLVEKEQRMLLNREMARLPIHEEG